MEEQLKIIMPFGGKEYISFLEKRFNVKVLKPNSKVIPSLLFFTGGADINPILYGEKPGSFTNFDDKRDKVDIEVFEKKYGTYNSVPKLGICRGAQLVCALSGGQLIQHVSGHAIGGYHSITIQNDHKEYLTTIDITSTHHQMMYPFNLSEANYDIIGYSTKFRSPMYLREGDDNVSICRGFLEPEIVYFYKTKSFAIQGHPEFTHCPKETVTILLDMIEERFNFTKYVKSSILKKRQELRKEQALNTFF